MRPVAIAVSLLVLTGIALSSCAEDTARAGEDGVRFTLEEEMRIDPYEHNLVPLNATRPMAVAEDGTIAIAQPQDAVVRIFSPDGEFLQEVGGRGAGPGEFQSVWRLGWMGGDTLWVYDQGLLRFTLIDPDLNYVRYVHVPNRAQPGEAFAGRLPAFGVVYGGALYADGSVYAQLAGPLSDALGDFDPGQILYGRVAEDGTILSYFQFPAGGSEPILVETDQGTAGLPSSLFPGPERPILRLADDGTHMAYLRVAPEGPDAGTFEVIVEDVLASDTLYARRYPYESTPIPPAVADSLIEVMAEGFPPEFQGPFRRGVQVPEEFPPIANIEMADDRSIWIQLRDTEEGRTYRILDPAGDPMGTVTVPTNVRLMTIKGDQVWAIERDQFDVETVVRYRVEGLAER